MEIASAFVSLLPSARGFGRNLESQLGRETQGAGKRLGAGFGKMFALGAGLLAGAGIASVLSDSIGEAREAQKVGALTESIIKSTGGAAKVTAKQVGKLAGAISLKTGMDDEAIQSGANLLLTFKQVRNEVGEGNKIFDRATAAAADLSAAGFGDLNGQAKMLGKALNDPIKGMSALSRSGVTFTEAQKEQVKALIASGDALSAQKIILSEVESQVGGAAAATATAGEKATVAFGNIKESLGTALLPVIDAAADGFLKIAPSIESGLAGVGPAIEGFVGWFTRSAIPAVSTFLDEVGRIASIGWGTLEAGATALGKFSGIDFSDIKELAATTWGKFQTGVDALDRLTKLDFSKIDGKELGKQLGTAISDGLTALGKLSGKLTSALEDLMKDVDWVGIGITVGEQVPAMLLGLTAGILAFDFESLWEGVKAHWGTILIGVLTTAFAPAKFIGPLAKVLGKIPFVGQFLARGLVWFNQLGRGFASKVGSFMGDLGKMFAKGFGKINIPGAGLVSSVLGALRAIPGKVREFLSLLGTRIGVWALDAFEFLGKGARSSIGRTLKFVGSIPGRILRAVGSLARLLFPRGVEALTGLLNGARGRVGAVLNFFKGIPARIKGAFGGAISWLASAGRNVVEGLWGGIKGAWDGVISRLSGLASGIPKAVKKVLGIFSPSRVMAEVGVWIPRGLAKGIDRGAPAAVKSARAVAKKVIDSVKSQIDSFKSLRDSIKQAFAPDLFSGDIGTFFSGLKTQLTSNNGVLAAFAKLKGMGLNKGFLDSLMASGNAGLITALGSTNAAAVKSAQADWMAVQRSASKIGNQVAANSAGGTLGELRAELQRLNRAVDRLPKATGREVARGVNRSASAGERNRR